MPQSLCQLYTHIVFSTKNRRPQLSDTQIRNETWAYLAGACRNLDSPSIIVGGARDHIHILCRLSKSITVIDFLRDIKRESSKWLKAKGNDLADFQWQAGYGAFSISHSHVEATRHYIENQEEHHKKESFQEEFLRLLRKFKVEFDEKYLWD